MQKRKTPVGVGSAHTYPHATMEDDNLKSTLVGYMRKARKVKGDDRMILKIGISVDAFNKAERIVTDSGIEYVYLVVDVKKVEELISGCREVTGVVQIVE